MFTSMSRTIGYSIAAFASAKRGTGPMSIIWCTAGVSGIVAPAIRASSGLHTPQAIATTSASTSPAVVPTRRTRPRSTSIPHDLDLGDDLERPGALGLLAHQRPRAQRVDHAHARRVKAAEDHRLVDVGDERLDLGGQQRDRLDAPGLGGRHAAPQLLHALLGARDLDAAAL